jgi:hypothetical protein
MPIAGTVSSSAAWASTKAPRSTLPTRCVLDRVVLYVLCRVCLGGGGTGVCMCVCMRASVSLLVHSVIVCVCVCVCVCARVCVFPGPLSCRALFFSSQPLTTLAVVAVRHAGPLAAGGGDKPQRLLGVPPAGAVVVGRCGDVVGETQAGLHVVCGAAQGVVWPRGVWQAGVWLGCPTPHPPHPHPVAVPRELRCPGSASPPHTSTPARGGAAPPPSALADAGSMACCLLPLPTWGVTPTG